MQTSRPRRALRGISQSAVQSKDKFPLTAADGLFDVADIWPPLTHEALNYALPTPPAAADRTGNETILRQLSLLLHKDLFFFPQLEKNLKKWTKCDASAAEQKQTESDWRLVVTSLHDRQAQADMHWSRCQVSALSLKASSGIENHDWQRRFKKKKKEIL